MKCMITNLETKNKWNNYPIHKIVIQAAKRDKLPNEPLRLTINRLSDYLHEELKTLRAKGKLDDKAYLEAIARALGMKE